MRAGECLYCGQTGHFLASCSLRPKRGSSPVAVEVLVSKTSSSFPRMQFQATLCLGVETYSLLALVDSGADENFLDINLASQAGIPVEPLDRYMDADALDGRLLAGVTHKT